MAKGKRELIIEVAGEQYSINSFKKMLDAKLKNEGVKYSDDIKMYFNIEEKKVYVVSNDDMKNTVIAL